MKKHLFVVMMIGLAALMALPTLQSQPVRAQDDAAQMYWWNERVFYEIFVRSFKDSDGDGIGDIQGVISMLDYLNDGDPTTTTDLGVTGIWLMPIMSSPTYHGYGVTDYEAINADYGSMEDFEQLLAEAEARGIAVIIDFVMNHTSSQHPWFEASAQSDPVFDDWYVWSDTQPEYRGPDSQQVWHNRNGRWYYGLFSSEMPDLNLTNPMVTESLFEIADAWVNDIGVDGFRLDAIKHFVEEGREQENTASTRAWLADFNAQLSEIAPDSLTVGEAWTTSYDAADYVTEGTVDLVFEFDLAAAMINSARQGNGDGMRSLQERMQELYPPGQYATFLTNHDQNRVFGEVRGNFARGRIGSAQIAASLLLTAPGVPFMYYGEEIGMTGMKPDERIRTPMQWDSTPETAGFSTVTPWQPLSDGFMEGVSVAEQTDDPDSLLSHYRNLIHLRNDHAALRTGSWTNIDVSSRKLYAFVRQTDDETLLIVINTSDDPVADYTLSLEEAFGWPGSTLNVLYTHNVTLDSVAALPLNEDGTFSDYSLIPEIPPHSTMIFQIGGEE